MIFKSLPRQAILCFCDSMILWSLGLNNCNLLAVWSSLPLLCLFFFFFNIYFDKVVHSKEMILQLQTKCQRIVYAYNTHNTLLFLEQTGYSRESTMSVMLSYHDGCNYFIYIYIYITIFRVLKTIRTQTTHVVHYHMMCLLTTQRPELRSFGSFPVFSSCLDDSGKL